MLPYDLFLLPTSNWLSSAKRKVARDWFDLFIKEIPVRLEKLESLVKSTPGFEKWKLDFNTECAEDLFNFYKKNLTTRPKTEEEIQSYESSIPKRFSNLIPVDKPVMTDFSLSLINDMAIYFGEYVRYGQASLHWEFYTSRKTIDFQNAVIIGNGLTCLHPRWIMKNQAYNIIENKKTLQSINDLKVIWLNALLP